MISCTVINTTATAILLIHEKHIHFIVIIDCFLHRIFQNIKQNYNMYR
jgi:hypothetical protein